MSFYSIYVFHDRVELHRLEHEHLTFIQGGRFVSTQKGYQASWESAIALAKVKQLPVIDRTSDAYEVLNAKGFSRRTNRSS